MNGQLDQSLIEQVKQALRTVVDPELGFNIFDLGLIYEVTADTTGTVHVQMTTTTRGCPATGYLQEGACNAVKQISQVVAVEVDLVYDPPWTPEKMSPAAKLHLGMDEGWGQ